MTEYAQQQRQHRRAEDRPETSGQDLRNGELSEDVACCLAEIDELLNTEQAEREQAVREFEALGKFSTNREMNIWQAKYAHLGLRYGRSCCGEPFLIDDREQ